ncbi:MAG: hypothetical protein GY838_13680 [bacterium]|nr:hypothetical protein [bacterium]
MDPFVTSMLLGGGMKLLGGWLGGGDKKTSEDSSTRMSYADLPEYWQNLMHEGGGHSKHSLDMLRQAANQGPGANATQGAMSGMGWSRSQQQALFGELPEMANLTPEQRAAIENASTMGLDIAQGRFGAARDSAMGASRAAATEAATGIRDMYAQAGLRGGTPVAAAQGRAVTEAWRPVSDMSRAFGAEMSGLARGAQGWASSAGLQLQQDQQKLEMARRGMLLQTFMGMGQQDLQAQQLAASRRESFSNAARGLLQIPAHLQSNLRNSDTSGTRTMSGGPGAMSMGLMGMGGDIMDWGFSQKGASGTGSGYTPKGDWFGGGGDSNYQWM